jgi:hypothetical protein
MEIAFVGFLGVLIGAFISWFSAVRLWRHQQEARNRGLLRAVLVEIDGILRLTYQFEIGRLALLRRTAFDAAREVALPDTTVAALSEAYARVESHNAAVTNLFGVMPSRNFDTIAMQREIAERVKIEIRPLFGDARVALAKHLNMNAPWTDPPEHWPKQT